MEGNTYLIAATEDLQLYYNFFCFIVQAYLNHLKMIKAQIIQPLKQSTSHSGITEHQIEYVRGV